MMESLSALAVVPKAKAIAARRLTKTEYAELMRKHSVLEIVAYLKEHPYFRHSLAGLDSADVHREQLEQALNKDIFYKYESLMHYVSNKEGFAGFFMMRCEIEELLQKLRLLAMGFHHHYITQLPGFLADKTSFSLIRLAQAETPQQCLAVVSGTPYARILAPIIPKKGRKLEHHECERVLWTYYYETSLKKIRAGRYAADTKRLFLMQAEIYNIDMLYRAKAFFAHAFTPQQLRRLMLPYHYALGPKTTARLAQAADLEEFLRIYNTSHAKEVYGERTAAPDIDDSVCAHRTLHKAATRLLHFSSSPDTVLVALLCLATIERSNIVSIVEGVRYGLSATQMQEFMKY